MLHSRKKIVDSKNKTFIIVEKYHYPSARPWYSLWSAEKYELYKSEFNGEEKTFLNARKAWAWAKTGTLIS